MNGRYDDILATIGRTPVVRICQLAPPDVAIYVKVEAFNPMGSVKDRLALGHHRRRRASRHTAARADRDRGDQRQHRHRPGDGVRGEGLSAGGDDGGELQHRAAQRMMRFLGAKVVLTPAALKGSGMLAKAVELAQAHDWFLCRQFENEANADMHSRTTAPEILADFAGERLDYLVTGYGTGGTLKGVARVLKAQRPDTRIVVCEPDNSPILGSGIAAAAPADGAPAESHPAFRPHLMQGWSPDFIPKLTEDAIDDAAASTACCRSTAPMRCGWSRELARREGIFVGISGGATLAGALQVAAEAAHGASVLLCMLPDTGERYLSTPLFEGHRQRHERRGTGRSRAPRRAARFDAPTPAPAPATDRSPDRRARRSRRRSLPSSSRCSPIPSSRWCCSRWSGASSAGRCASCSPRCGIPYRSVDLDSTAVPARRPRRPDPRAASRAHRQPDHPAGVRRRRVHRRLHRDLRYLPRWTPAAVAQEKRRALQRRRRGRSVQAAARVVATALVRRA